MMLRCNSKFRKENYNKGSGGVHILKPVKGSDTSLIGGSQNDIMTRTEGLSAKISTPIVTTQRRYLRRELRKSTNALMCCFVVQNSLISFRISNFNILFNICWDNESGFLNWVKQSPDIRITLIQQPIPRINYIDGLVINKIISPKLGVNRRFYRKARGTRKQTMRLYNPKALIKFFNLFHKHHFLCFLRLLNTEGMAQLKAKKTFAQEATAMPIPRIKIPRFDNSALIAKCSKVLLGKCLNPAKQDVGALIQRFPRIWRMEDRVTGTDLCFGRFQFAFKHSEDMEAVLQLGATHFDGWMITLAKWIPKAPEDYPSTLTMWARISNVPAEYAAVMVYEAIGAELGKVVKIDAEAAKILVEVNVMKALVTKTSLEFADEVETIVKIKYDRHQGICTFCNYINHDVTRCKRLMEQERRKSEQGRLERNERNSDRQQSFKGALMNNEKGELGGKVEYRRVQPKHLDQYGSNFTKSQLEFNLLAKINDKTVLTHKGEKVGKTNTEGTGQIDSVGHGKRKETQELEEERTIQDKEIKGTFSEAISTSKKTRISPPEGEEVSSSRMEVISELTIVEKKGDQAGVVSVVENIDPMLCDVVAERKDEVETNVHELLSAEDLESLKAYGTITEEEHLALLSEKNHKVTQKPPLLPVKKLGKEVSSEVHVETTSRAQKSTSGIKGISLKKQHLLDAALPQKRLDKTTKVGKKLAGSNESGTSRKTASSV